MPNKLNRKPKPVSPSKREDSWEKKFNALCYEVFFRNQLGKELLDHLEKRFFRSPVANPNMDAQWAFFNEGKNELIRSFTAAIQKHLTQPKPKQPVRDTNV